MFQGGECRVSKMMSGFCDRLRDYPEISLPPVLLFDPLMFQGGECRVSKMMSGFCDRLRDYPEISLPPVLLFDPLKFQIDSDGGHMEGKVDDLIDTQRTLKQMRR